MKYLITSNYQYYDDFNFSNVCVCDTRERAEELVQEFKNNIEIYENTQGYEIYIDKDIFEETIFSDFEDVIILKDLVKVFIKSDIFNKYKDALDEDALDEDALDEDALDEDALDESDVYYEEINFYNFLTNMYWSNESDDIRCRYCNHDEAVLSIYEIPSM